MTASRPLLTVLRLGAIVLAVGVGGYLVIGAQRRATGGGEATPAETLAQPTLGPQGDVGEVFPEPADPYLFSSKSAAIEVLPEGASAAGDEVFLPSSKDPGPDVLLPALAGGDAPTYLPSSKVLSPDALKAMNGAPPPPPEHFLPSSKSFLPSSKSLSIDADLLDSQSDPSTIASDGLVIPNDDVRAAREMLSADEKRAIYLTTSKSLSPDALPGAKAKPGTTPEQAEAPKESGKTQDAKDAPAPKKD